MSIEKRGARPIIPSTSPLKLPVLGFLPASYTVTVDFKTTTTTPAPRCYIFPATTRGLFSL